MLCFVCAFATCLLFACDGRAATPLLLFVVVRLVATVLLCGRPLFDVLANVLLCRPGCAVRAVPSGLFLQGAMTRAVLPAARRLLWF